MSKSKSKARNASKNTPKSYDFAYVILLGIAIILRNCFMPQIVVSRYGKFPLKYNPAFVRSTLNHCSTLLTGQHKSLHRNIFFNLMRVVLPDVIKQLAYTGKLNVQGVISQFVFTVALSVVLQYMPQEYFKKFRYVWTWMCFEHFSMHAASLIHNRNMLTSLYDQNLLLFFAFLYLEYQAMLTSQIMEGLLYRDYSLFSLPSLIYNGTFNYIIAMPALTLIQVFHLGNRFKIYMPLSFYGLWSQKLHISNFWQHIDIYNPDHFYIWSASVVIFALLNGISIYARLIGMSKLVATDKQQKLQKQVDSDLDEKQTEANKKQQNPKNKVKSKKQEKKRKGGKNKKLKQD